MPVGREIEVPISLLATKLRSSLKGAVLGRVVLLQSSARDGGGACRNKPGEKKKKGVGLRMRSICLQRTEMGKTSEGEQIAPSLDLEIVYSISCCSVLRDGKETTEAGVVNRERKIFAAYLL